MEAKNEKLKVVIVGTGDMANRHCQGWTASGMADIVAVVGGKNLERLEKFQEEHNIRHGSCDYRKTIDKFKPDVVSVCVPVPFHPEIAIYAAEAKCHVFCEKPIALTIEDGEKMIAACRGNGVLLGIDFDRRYWEDYLLYQQLIEDNALGRPLIWKRFDIRSIRPKILMHDKNGNGGVFIDCAVHWFDMWRHLFDSEPTTVYALGGCWGKDKPQLRTIQDKALDTGVITVKYASGDVGELSTSWGLPVDTPTVEGDILVGPKGYCRFDGKMVETVAGAHRSVKEVKLEEWGPIITDFTQAVLGMKKNPVPGEDAISASKVALAAIESIETGTVVEL